jgi:hypothetical protein
VEAGDGYAKFWLSPVSLATAAGFNAKELRQIRMLFEEHTDLCLEKWNEHLRNR